MPTYSYACTACEHRFDTVQAFSDASLTECPECAGRLRKLFSSVGIVFKGSGFYRTDSRSGDGSDSKPDKSESADSKSETAKPDTAKPDTAKPDTAKSDGTKSDGTKSNGKKGTSSSASSAPSSSTASAAAS